MPEPPRLIYWDSCVFLDYINGVPDKIPVIEALMDMATSTGRIEIITSTLSITEVAYGRLDQTGHAFDPAVESRIDALWDDPLFKLVEFHKLIAVEARALIRSARLAGVSLQGADAIHLATAFRMQAAEFHTYDTRLFQHSGRLGLPISEPKAIQPRLTDT